MKLAERLPLENAVPRTGLADFSAHVKRRAARTTNSNKIKTVSAELPDFLLVFALAVKSGASVPLTLSYLAERANGQLANDLKEIQTTIDLGASLVQELQDLSNRLPTPRIEEFTQSLISNLEFGATISDSLLEQSKSASEEFARQLAKRAASNETKMLIPTIFLILPVTVLFAIYPSLVMLTEAI